MENTWHLRRVADSASKACWICYKPSTSVLITPNNKVHGVQEARRSAILILIRTSSISVSATYQTRAFASRMKPKQQR
jgi:hypothetical protein